MAAKACRLSRAKFLLLFGRRVCFEVTNIDKAFVKTHIRQSTHKMRLRSLSATFDGGASTLSAASETEFIVRPAHFSLAT